MVFIAATTSSGRHGLHRCLGGGTNMVFIAATTVGMGSIAATTVGMGSIAATTKRLGADTTALITATSLATSTGAVVH
jgi:hypothetical protein